MPPRSLLPGFRTQGDRVAIRGEEARHLARVLRVREGESIVVFDGEGWEANGRVLSVRARGDEVLVALDGPARAGIGADASSVVWLQGYPKADKLERIARQATELGVRALWPVFTARSVPRSAGTSRIERLREIVASAASQCGRADLPAVREPTPLDDALAALDATVALRIVAWEESQTPLARVIASAPAGGCAVLVGPEGGLAGDEVARAEARGFVPVSLGPRVLRTETVAPALLAILSLLRGDLREG